MVPRECGAVLMSGSLALQDAFELRVQLSALLHMSSKCPNAFGPHSCCSPRRTVGLVRWKSGRGRVRQRGHDIGLVCPGKEC